MATTPMGGEEKWPIGEKAWWPKGKMHTAPRLVSLARTLSPKVPCVTCRHPGHFCKVCSAVQVAMVHVLPQAGDPGCALSPFKSQFCHLLTHSVPEWPTPQFVTFRPLGKKCGSPRHVLFGVTLPVWKANTTATETL